MKQNVSYIWDDTGCRIDLVSIRHGVYELSVFDAKFRMLSADPVISTYIRGNREKLKCDIKEAFVLD